MDTFVCSSWYYFRYTDPKNDKEFAAKDKIKKWLPVDLYVGGAEHTVMHLLYSRFFTKVLHKLDYIDFDEPFLKLRHQGIILGEDNYKMSKSRGNVINPDDVINEFGADALRMFEMFMGPLEDMKPWNTKGIIGIRRFLDKVWKLQYKLTTNDQQPTTSLNSLMHKTIKKVTEDIENLRFNTAISALMILLNKMEREKELRVTNYELLITLLSPFAPHITEELWEKLGNKESIFKEKWPKYDPKLIKDEEIELVVQVNGKVRDRLKTSADISEEEAKKLAIASEKVKNYIAGKEIKKAIFVKGKLINFVV
jgi:leucyl-tRNA synthetase